jgi:anthranilate phosphoribosyltransferase
LTQQLAHVLETRGATLAWVVHGHDGLCDLSITGPSQVTQLRDGQVSTFMVHPDDVGLPPADLNDLLIESPQASAAVIMQILDGVVGPPRHHAVLNAAAALLVSGKASDLHQGVEQASQAIDSGAARRKLQHLAECSHTPEAKS